MDQRRLGALADAMQPVFIVGAPRSGSSLLYRTLQHHPSFLCHNADGGVNLQETDIVSLLPSVTTFDRKRHRKLVQYLLRNEQAVNAFVESIAPHQGEQPAPDSRLGRLVERVRRRLGRRESTDVTIVRNFFAIAKQARGTERLVEKTPHHIEHLSLFRQAFPSAQFLYIYRHPVEVYSSYRRRADVDPKATWARLTPREFVELYGRMSRVAIAEAKRHSDLLLVSYERFVQEPAAAFAEVCAFLGEPFVERALAPREQAEYRIDPHLFGEITTDTKDWRDYASEAEAAEIEDRLTDVMRHWGYGRLTTASVLSP